MPTTTEPPRLYPTLRYRNAAKMIDWLCEAFGFSVHARYRRKAMSCIMPN